jgi:cyclase
MIRTRVIPALLLKGDGLVKTVKFSNPGYIGDPINAVRIFNDKEVHELVFLDITASIERRPPRFDILSDIASECFMPLGYGGGIRTLEQAEKIFNLGVEKIILNSFAIEDPSFIRSLSDRVGSQSVVMSIDVKKNFFGKYEIYSNSGKTRTSLDPFRWAQQAEELGAGEIILNSIDQDGTMKGYDIQLIKNVSNSVTIPVVACGGAGKVEDFGTAIHEGGASAVAAGSMFVYFGRKKAVLINYPSRDEIETILKLF